MITDNHLVSLISGIQGVMYTLGNVRFALLLVQIGERIVDDVVQKAGFGGFRVEVFDVFQR